MSKYHGWFPEDEEDESGDVNDAVADAADDLTRHLVDGFRSIELKSRKKIAKKYKKKLSASELNEVFSASREVFLENVFR